jgi:chromosomal replication initiator protein
VDNFFDCPQRVLKRSMDNTISDTQFNTTRVWSDFLESTKVSVSLPQFTSWFAPTHLISIKKNDDRYIAEIGCNSAFTKNTLEQNYFSLIQSYLEKTLEAPVDLLFVVHQKEEVSSTPQKPAPLFDTIEGDEEQVRSALFKSGIRLTYTFSNFAVSGTNQMAHAAAEAVAGDPGRAYNPLFLWGGVGVGKTHLMHAVGHHLLRKDSSLTIVACTGEQFTNDIVEGIKTKSTQKVREKYRKVAVLLLDDIQFIAGKVTVQEEFFHTFNTLVGAGSQIILTSDRPPSEIANLEERLRSRFEAGLIVDISPPDFELRCAIVQIKAQEKGLSLETDFAQLIAGNIDSARKLEGVLTRLITEAKFKKLEITRELIETIIGKGESGGGDLRTKVTPHEMIDAVSKYYSVGKKVLLGDSRVKTIAEPRQVLMYLLRTQLGLAFEEVGRLVGGRDHTTVMHAVDKITQLASNNVNTRTDLQGIKGKL